ncbi:ABC transporter substrate-binding protein [Levilinea saccharolytica]|uniref:Solute-binding protein family 3/N-terminal domain-containing protein n=1 Tax=Levilinea saccharolytica TaxID=229921 RepID=A0A0P6YPZ1_9CHLR|nr:MetQ/NlpA family ABC transporter substrate-binding protein [Levilinea saccharolytica]KPL85068.1 hypothetical protein ADN01_06755 [Levilinea saccharolytica]GAP18174.1 ABC-type nitrate/sulfonate/bicarbonate transport system, periplasmic component [Levilinea saccharolytica]
MMRRFWQIVLVFGVLLTACTPKASQQQKVRIAVLPVIDALPIYVAQQEGYFKEQGVEVEIVPVLSAPERDQLMQSGQVDSILTEVVVNMIYNKETPQIKTVRFLRTTTVTTPMFRILASKDSGINTVADLAGVPIAISEGTVIEYMTDRVLEKAGMAPTDIAKVAVPKISDRMAFLDSGQVQAAVMPDPLASLSIKNGARVIIDDTSYPEVSHSVLAFRIETLNQQGEAVRKVLAGVEQAVTAINGDKTRWNGLLAELKLVPEPLLKDYVLPDYPLASVPSEEQFADAMQWAREKGLIQKDLQYADCVDASFLP